MSKKLTIVEALVKTVEAVKEYADAELSEAIVYVTPQMFGAVGDGVTDDTAAFKECFKHTNIYIPVGTYVVSETIDVLNKTNVAGNTRESTKINGTGDVVFNCQGFAYFSNMGIVGNGNNTGISFPQKYLRLTNVGFTSLNIGVTSREDTTIMFNSFVGCRFYYTDYPIVLDTSNYQTNTTVISDCIFAVYKNAITAHMLTDVSIDRCTFEGDSTQCILDIDIAALISFVSCYIECSGALLSDRYYSGAIILRDTWINKHGTFIGESTSTKYFKKITLDHCRIANADSDEESFDALMSTENIVLDLVNCITVRASTPYLVEITSPEIAREYGVASNCIINHGCLTLDTLPVYNGEVE